LLPISESMKKDKSQQPSSHTSKEKSKPFDSEK
jgi:hypothetical protein